MTFGLTIEKLVMIAFIAAMLIGPTRLPAYAAALARTVRRTREFLRDTTDRVKGDLGPEIGDVDWRSLDPRRYDPRRIVLQALLDDDTPGPGATRAIDGDADGGRGNNDPRPNGYTPQRYTRAIAAAESASIEESAGPPGR
ncbi:Sec-independent protein translocase TatB [Microbacterium sp. NPDC056044]|uniref:Sec-independent protein translocase TatB n=1 Tax=Microbacterium sp. NPDC056044 TaxID=3345690 RepID=UPI0035DEAACA